jgi:hypothetical protein
MVFARGRAYNVASEDADFHLTKAGLMELTRELVAGAYGAPWPPAPPPIKQPAAAVAALPIQLTDTQRLDALEKAGGFVAGMDAGKRAYRVFGSDQWHGSLRGAIDSLPGTSAKDDA